MYAIPNVMNKVLPLLAVIDATAAANAADIVTNAEDIVANAADIVTNAADIVTNAEAIAALGGVVENIIGDNPVTVDSEDDDMLVGHAYLTQTAGFVSAYYPAGYTAEGLYIYVGDTDDPQGAGEEVTKIRTAASGIPAVSTYVGKGKYFQVRCAVAMKILWTPHIAGGEPPIDHN